MNIQPRNGLKLISSSCRTIICKLFHSNLLPKTATAYIAGEWTPAASGQTFEVSSPATGEVLHSIISDFALFRD